MRSSVKNLYPSTDIRAGKNLTATLANSPQPYGLEGRQNGTRKHT